MAKRLLAQAVNLFVSAVRVGMVTWGPNGIDSLLDLKWLNFSDPEVATWYASICLCKSTQYLYVAGFYCFFICTQSFAVMNINSYLLCEGSVATWHW